jgi:hypothetical protein
MEKQLLKSGTFWTIFFGVITIILAFYIYIISSEKRLPVYCVKKEPSLIFDKSNSSPKIKLISNDSIAINNNVYITTLVLWNKGNLQIKKEDIRKEFTIIPKGGAVILDYSIIKETKQGLSNFRILNDNKTLKIDWDYFDPKFGMELQVIYAGNPNSEILIDGYVLGSEVKKISVKKNTSPLSIVLDIITISIAVLLYYFLFRKGLNLFNSKFSKIGIIILTILYTLLVLTIIYKYYFQGNSIPL